MVLRDTNIADILVSPTSSINHYPLVRFPILRIGVGFVVDLAALLQHSSGSPGISAQSRRYHWMS